MNAFLVDLTHGGVKISSELAKGGEYEDVFAYDLYGTLKEDDECFLKRYGVKVINSLDDFKKAIESYSNFLNNHNHNTETTNQDLEISSHDDENSLNKKGNSQDRKKDLIINPIHSSLNISNLLEDISNDLKLNSDEKNQFYNSFEILNHHTATKLVLSKWREKAEIENVDCIEITGVKGKTSVAYLLKEIMLENQKDTLLLSSLGAHLFRTDQDMAQEDVILMKNISITPANIINTIQYANKIVNPKCSGEEFLEKSLNYDAAIFENSLGVCGLGDIGVLTNIVENYPIAKGSSNARNAKKQVFDCSFVVIEKETLNEHYPEESEIFQSKINTFSINDSEANVHAQNVSYDLGESEIKVAFHDLKVFGDEKLKNGEIIIKTFAPGRHHVLNTLAALTAALTLGIEDKIIQKGLKNFKGIEGRTHLEKVGNSIIIEEINPGINTKAIESSIKMIKNIDDYHIIIGGRYGITCEEIDEDKLSNFLNGYMAENPNVNLILTDELGLSIKKQLDRLNDANSRNHAIYIESYEDAQNKAISENKNILFIYRSNYSQISKR